MSDSPGRNIRFNFKSFFFFFFFFLRFHSNHSKSIYLYLFILEKRKLMGKCYYYFRMVYKRFYFLKTFTNQKQKQFNNVIFIFPRKLISHFRKI